MEGYQTSRFNALKHGLLSKHTVLSWEDETEYQQPAQYQITSRAALTLIAPDFEGFGSSKTLSVDADRQKSLIQESETRAINAYNILSRLCRSPERTEVSRFLH